MRPLHIGERVRVTGQSPNGTPTSSTGEVVHVFEMGWVAVEIEGRSYTYRLEQVEPVKGGEV